MVFLYTLIAISFLSILSLVPFLWCSSSKRSISLIVTIFMMITMMMTTMTMMIISIIMIYILMKSPTPYLLREMGCLDHWLNELLIDLVPQRSPCHTNYCQSVKNLFFLQKGENHLGWKSHPHWSVINWGGWNPRWLLLFSVQHRFSPQQGTPCFKLPSCFIVDPKYDQGQDDLVDIDDLGDDCWFENVDHRSQLLMPIIAHDDWDPLGTWWVSGAVLIQLQFPKEPPSSPIQSNQLWK